MNPSRCWSGREWMGLCCFRRGEGGGVWLRPQHEVKGSSTLSSYDLVQTHLHPPLPPHQHRTGSRWYLDKLIKYQFFGWILRKEEPV